MERACAHRPRHEKNRTDYVKKKYTFILRVIVMAAHDERNRVIVRKVFSEHARLANEIKQLSDRMTSIVDSINAGAAAIHEVERNTARKHLNHETEERVAALKCALNSYSQQLEKLRKAVDKASDLATRKKELDAVCK